MGQADQSPEPRQVFGVGKPVDEHSVDPLRHPGKMEDATGAIEDREHGDHRQIERPGDLLQVSGQVALRARPDLQRGLQRPLDHPELGAPGSPREQGPADGFGHQPGIKMPARQARDLTHHFRDRRTGAGPEMLDPPAFSASPASKARAMTEGSGPAAAVARASRGTSIIAVPKNAEPIS